MTKRMIASCVYGINMGLYDGVKVYVRYRISLSMHKYHNFIVYIHKTFLKFHVKIF